MLFCYKGINAIFFIIPRTMPIPEEPCFKDIENRIKLIKSTISEIVVIMKYIEKNKMTHQHNKKREVVQKQVVNELAEFMILKDNTTTRQDIIRSISKYVKDNKLQKTENKREFIIDAKLSKLLGLKPNTNLTFLGINKHISHLILPTNARK